MPFAEFQRFFGRISSKRTYSGVYAGARGLHVRARVGVIVSDKRAPLLKSR